MKVVVAVAVVGLGACASDADPAAAIKRVPLRSAMGFPDDPAPVGVAVTPDGSRYLYDEGLGLYRIDVDNGTSQRVLDNARLPDPGAAAPVNFPVTDLAALDDHRFLLTAIGDGYILDLAANTLQRQFCYVPDGGGGGGDAGGGGATSRQRTDALAFDPVANLIYAQPITSDAATGAAQYASLASYDGTTGVNVGWSPMSSLATATAMLVWPEGGIVLATGSVLSRFDAATGASTPIADLAAFDIASIDGIAYDAAHDTLVVVDRQRDQLVELPRSLAK